MGDDVTLEAAEPAVVSPDEAELDEVEPDDVEPDGAELDDVDLDDDELDDIEADDEEPDDVEAEDVELEDAGPDDGAARVVPVAETSPPHPADRPADRPAARPDGWRALAFALRPRLNRAQILAALLCGLLGFAVVAQVRQTHAPTLSSLRQSDLVGILDQATTEADRLQREAATLEQTLQELQSGSSTRQAALDAATRSAAAQGILTGRLPAEGPGLEIVLTETTMSLRAVTMLNVLEELRNAGAEAVQLNDLRLTATSYFVSDDGTLVVDGTEISAPYRWLVIGDPDTMATALDIPGGASAGVRGDKGRIVVNRKDLVEVTATKHVPTPEHATPVPVDGS